MTNGAMGWESGYTSPLSCGWKLGTVIMEINAGVLQKAKIYVHIMIQFTTLVPILQGLYIVLCSIFQKKMT